MDKAGFLRELREHLMILKEEEQKDILDEYAQHIDMKMGSGMSEAEAIRDFGTVGELAAEILEAYHVDPRYSSKKRLKSVHIEEIPVQSMKEAGKTICKNGTGALKRFGHRIAAGFRRLWGGLMKPAAAVKEACKNRKMQFLAEREEAGKTAYPKRKTSSDWVHRVVRGVRKLMIIIINAVITCIRWTWNACMAGIAVMLGMAALGCVFCMGMLAVLLAQGYPLAGVTIGCLGAVMCTGGLTVLALSLIRRKKVRDSEKRNEIVVVQEVEEHA